MVNLFWTSLVVDEAVSDLTESHVGSCVFEGSIICQHAAKHRAYDAQDDLWTHHIPHHPCIDYAASHPVHWTRSFAFTLRAHEEWRDRNDKADGEMHGAVEHLLSAIDVPVFIEDTDWPDDTPSPPPKVTAEWKDTLLSAPEAYRYYVANDKDHLHEWPEAEPAWVESHRTSKPPEVVSQEKQNITQQT